MKTLFFTLTLLTVLTPLTRGATVFVLPNNARATNLTIVGGSASGLTNTGGTFTGGSFTGTLTGTNAVLTTPSIAGGTNTGSLITGATITGSLTGTNAVLTTPSIAGGTNTGSLITGATITGSLTGTNAVLTTPSITGGTNTSALFLSATLSGFTSALQTNTDLTASRVLVSDSAQRVTNSTVTATTLGYLDATSSVQTQLNGKGAATNGTYSGGTFTGATNAGLTVFGSASVTNSATSKLLVYSNLTALGSLRVGGAADTQTGNSLYGGDAIISGQIFGGGAAQNSGNALALNYEAGSALLPVIVFDNRTGTNAQMHMEFRLAGTRKGYIGYLGAASANARMMCINDDAGDGIQFQVGNNASGQGYRFYTGEGGGRYLMKLHPTAGGLAIGSSYWSTAPATNGVNIEGKVGLAVTSPQYQLDVGGTGRFTGTNTLWFGGTSGAADGNVGLYNITSGRLYHSGSLENAGNMNVGFYGAGSLANFHVKGAVSTAPVAIFGSTGNSPTNDFLQIHLNGTNKFSVDKNFTINQQGTITTAGTTGAQTINKPLGTVNFAAAATTLVVTSSAVGTASDTLVFVQVNGTDATFTSARVTVGTGQFTITANAAATAETAVSFQVLKIK